MKIISTKDRLTVRNNLSTGAANMAETHQRGQQRSRMWASGEQNIWREVIRQKVVWFPQQQTLGR